MNSYNAQELFAQNEILHNFRFLPPEILAELRASYGLTVGVGELIFCQQQYKKENRDPSISELRLIDRVITGVEKKPSAILVADVKTDNPEIGTTFNDLRTKLEALEKKAPFSFSDIAAAADLYLARAGKKTAATKIYGKCTDDGKLKFAVKGCREQLTLERPELNSSVSVGTALIPPYSRAAASDSDSFILITSQETAFEGDFAQTVSEILTDAAHRDAIKRADTVGEDGVLPFLLSTAQSFYADVSAFPGFEDAPSPLRLVSMIRETVILLADGKSVIDLANAAKEKGLRFIAFGRPLRGGKISIRYVNGYPLTVDAAFLRSLSFTASVSVDLIKEAEPTEETIEIAELAEPACKTAVKRADGLIVSAASSVAGSFRDALDTVVASVTPLIAAGVSLDDIAFSFDAKLPLLAFCEKDIGRALETLLGQYRAQAEFALRSDGSRYICTKDELAFTAYARAALPEITVGDTVTKDEGTLYLTSPLSYSDGFYRFEAVRALFDKISKLVRSGKVKAVRAVGKEGIEAAISEMTGGAHHTEYLVPARLANAPVGTFIIESDEKLDMLDIKYSKIADSADEL